MTNAFRHAGADTIVAELSYQSSGLHLAVIDDGCGIDENVLRAGSRQGHWGLPGMRERAGKLRGELRVARRRDGGTQVDLHVPASVAFAGRWASR